jgi:hypothetical protein
MDIVFDFKGDPIGGQLINYLLEKVLKFTLLVLLNEFFFIHQQNRMLIIEPFSSSECF